MQGLDIGLHRGALLRGTVWDSIILPILWSHVLFIALVSIRYRKCISSNDIGDYLGLRLYITRDLVPTYHEVPVSGRI